MPHLLEVEGLTTVFDSDYGRTVSVDHVNFHVDKGEVVCIVGESGCGKSVTSLSIMGLLGRGGTVTEGSVVFEDKNLLTMTEKELDKIRGDRLTMIFQDPLTSLDPVFTVGNQLMESIRKHMRLSKEEARKRAEQILGKVGMPDPHSVMKKYPHTLSGGMRQRVMIAMALCCNPGLLIADEPTTALDVTIQAQIMALLRNLQKESGMSMILITHDIGLVASMADRVIVMYAGQMIEEAPVKELFAAPAHPYTKALLQTVPGIYDEKDRELVAIPGMVPENYDSIPGCRFADRCAFRTKGCDQPQSYRQIGEGHFVRCMLAKKEKREDEHKYGRKKHGEGAADPGRKPEKILSHPGRRYYPYDRLCAFGGRRFLFDCRGRNPRSGGRIRLRQIDGGQTAGRPGKADGRQAVLSWEGYGEAFRKREKERAHAAADGVPGPIFFPESEKAYL